jgi:hypothetical protein
MSFLYPEQSKMSTSANRKSILLVIKTGTSIKTDGITNLTGANNDQTWKMQVEYLHTSIDAEEIVLENLQLQFNAMATELRLYQKIVKNPLAILILRVTPEILTTCPHHLSPHELWIHLHSLYY